MFLGVLAIAGSAAGAEPPAAETVPRFESIRATLEPPTDKPDPQVTWVQVTVDRPRPGEEAELLTYLTPFITRPATPKTLVEAERWLLRLDRYQAAHCRFWRDPAHEGRMRCGVARARIVRAVDIEGLPIRLLRTDLEKRIFLRPGTPLDTRDARGVSARDRQRARIIDYLERKGYYGAEVEIETASSQESSEVDVKVVIRGGAFVRVHEVLVEDAGPIDKDAVGFAFQWMCLTVDGFLDGFETFELNCLTHDQLRATKERIEALLQRQGFPEARVRVTKEFIDSTDEGSDRLCRYSPLEQKLWLDEDVPPPPRCVRLRVKVTPGPRLITSVVVLDGPYAEYLFTTADVARAVLPAAQVGAEAGRWVVGVFGSDDDGADPAPMSAEAVRAFLQPTGDLLDGTWRSVREDFLEPVSIAVQQTTGDVLGSTEDSAVWLADLQANLTFDENRSVDELEAETTRGVLEDVLRRRGYFNAVVKMKYTSTPEVINILYEVYPGSISAVRSVSFVGNEAFSATVLGDAVELATQPRSLTNRGFVTRQDLENDVQRILRFYESKGYRDIDVGYKGVRNADGYVDIEFRIEEGEQYTLGSLEVEGGNLALNMQVLRNLVHCKGGAAAKQGRAPNEPKDCVGAPFLPDEIAADEKRVLNTYVARGYLYTKVEIEPTFSEAGPGLVIKIGSTLEDDTVGDPDVVRRGMVFIDGDRVTNRAVMMREFGDLPSVIRPEQIQAGIKRLRRTGIYDRVKLDYIGVDEKSDRVHLRIDVEEKPAWTWDASAAFSTDRYFSIRNEFRNKNVLGRMLDLSAVADFGLFIGRESSLSSSLRWPRLFGLPLTLSATPALSYQDRPSSYVSRQPGGAGKTGAVPVWFANDIRRRNFKIQNTIGIESRPFSTIDLTFGLDNEYRLEWDDADARTNDPLSLDNYATIDGITTTLDRTPLRINALIPRVTYRSLNNPFDPTEGFSVAGSLQMGLPFLSALTDYTLPDGYGWIAFPFHQEAIVLPKLEGAYYFSLSRLTLAVHARGWVGASFGEKGRKSTLLQQDLLVVGGDRTVRGYLRDRIGVPQLPTLAQNNVDVTDQGLLILGGAVANAELRYTLVRNFFIGDLKVAGFVDGGFVTYNDWSPADEDWLSKHFDPAQPRVGASVGAGVRYVLPVGPLSFDVGVPVLALAEQDPAFNVHIQLGYAF